MSLSLARMRDPLSQAAASPRIARPRQVLDKWKRGLAEVESLSLTRMR